MSKIKIYTPASTVRRPKQLLKQMIKDLVLSRDLAMQLYVRDFKAQYRQSLLGIFWAFLIPLANTVTWLFLRSSGVVSLADTDIPYPIYVFTGTMLWAIFSESIQAPLQKTISGKAMITKINFPYEALILSSIYQSIGNAGIKVALIIGFLILQSFPFSWTMLLFPVGVLSLILAGTAIGLLLTPFGLLYNDIGRALPVLMQFLMYLTPVVFTAPKKGWIGTLISSNPITTLIVTSRDWIAGHVTLNPSNFILVNTVFLALFVFVWIIYRASMPVLIERLSS